MPHYPLKIAEIPVLWFATLASTNQEALARVGPDTPAQFWIVADQQAAGRGRRGRTWVSEPGNLYATRIVTGSRPAVATPEVCFVAALALHDAVLECCPGLAAERLRLKWPNDLLLDGEKLAGILVEAISGQRAPVVAIGFGINCRVHPKNVAFPATDLSRAGFVVSPAAVLEALGSALERRLREWDGGKNFAAIREDWLERACGLGAAIEVRLGDRTLDGTFEALDESGCLVLLRADGVRETVRAGDVFPVGG
jgi:BirA family biotin operon repressor/biotin-[acetyl-CoA-carboxylase] ligase